jgi:hypothetical protein
MAEVAFVAIVGSGAAEHAVAGLPERATGAFDVVGFRAARPSAEVGAGRVVSAADAVVRRRRGLAADLRGALGAVAAWSVGRALAVAHPADGPLDEDAQLGLCEPEPRMGVARVDGEPVAVILDGTVARPAAGPRALHVPAGDAEAGWLQALARSTQRARVHQIVDAIGALHGRFRLAVVTPDWLVAARDPWGFCELFVAAYEGRYAIATDRDALSAWPFHAVRELDPGEVWIVDAEGPASLRPFRPVAPTPCALRVASGMAATARVGGGTVRDVRRAGGAAVWAEAPAVADAVVALDADAAAAEGLARASGLPRVEPFVGEVCWPGDVQGKTLVAVAARWTDAAAERAVALLDAGAAAVHVRWLVADEAPCPYGLSHRAGRAAWGFASGVGLSLGAWLAAIGASPACHACLGGPFPVEIDAARAQLGLFGEAPGEAPARVPGSR